MNEHTLIEIIQRQISGIATDKDLASLIDWLKEDEENFRCYDTLYNIYQIATINTESFVPDKEKAWQNIMQNITIPKIQNHFLSMFLRYSAAAVIFFLLGLSINKIWLSNRASEKDHQLYTIIVPLGQKSQIVLADGTKVWLNSGTTLKYYEDFNKYNRNVTLNGEAFFEVAKDKTHKFTVFTGNTSVEVYGTAFNVKNYTSDNKMELSVKEGKVVFLTDGEKVSDLIIGDHLILVKETKKTLLDKGDIEMITAWKNDQLVFNATPINELAKYLERWYGVSIKIENNQVANRRYSFKVKTETMKELLNLINIMTPIDYKINGKDVTIRYKKK